MEFSYLGAILPNFGPWPAKLLIRYARVIKKGKRLSRERSPTGRRAREKKDHNKSIRDDKNLPGYSAPRGPFQIAGRGKEFRSWGEGMASGS